MKTDKYIDKEEEQIIKDYNNDKFEEVDPSLLKLAGQYVKIKKNKQLTIRLPNEEVNDLKNIALHEGIPYHTLIGSIIHKYINKYKLHMQKGD